VVLVVLAVQVAQVEMPRAELTSVSAEAVP